MPAPLRVRRTGKGDSATRMPRSSLAKTNTPDSYVQRLLKLIPTEVVSAFLVGREIATKNDYSSEWALWCLVLTFVFRILMTYETSADSPTIWDRLKSVQWPAVIIATISFAVWAFTLGDKFPAPLPSLEQWEATLVLLIWTPLVPYLYSGTDDSKPDRPQVLGATPGSLTGSGMVTPSSPATSRPRAHGELPHRVMKDVIGRDDRKRVTAADQVPFSNICLLHSFHGNETLARKMGTGWFLRPNIIVTAAHVVFDEATFGDDGFADKVFGWPGYDGSSQSNPSFASSELFVHPDYVRNLSLKSDIAVIRIDDDMARKGLAFISDPPADRTPIMVAGYPADKGGLSMYQCAGSVIAVDGDFVFYNSDTENGESGAPVINDNGIVIATHIDGKQFSGQLPEEGNLGIRLHSGILGWMQQFL